ncbi:MAG: hypothetical protein O2807_06970 [bacterium]|nr:hypothetical protein [bacterium]
MRCRRESISRISLRLPIEKISRLAAAGVRTPEVLSIHPSGSQRIRQLRAWLPGALRHDRPGR